MNQINLSQFIIGSQYEDYEFELYFKEIEIKENLEYLIYRYKKNEKHFLFDIEITGGVFLFFNGDILTKICFHFCFKKYQDILSNLKIRKSKLKIIKSKSEIILLLK